MLDTAKQEHNGIQPKLPLIRLRTDCSNLALAISANHFAQKMVGRVANPKDVILFKTRRQSSNKRVEMDLELIDELTDDAKFTHVCKIDDVIQEYFNQVDSTSQLNFLYEKLLTECVRDYVEKDICKMQSVIDWHLKEVQAKFTAPGVKLDKILVDEHLVREMVQDFKENLRVKDEASVEKIGQLLKLDNQKEKKSPKASAPKKAVRAQEAEESEEVLNLSESDVEMEEAQVKKLSGRGSRGGRGKSATTSKPISDYMRFKR